MAREISFDPADGDHGPAYFYGKGVENPGKPGDYHRTKGPKARSQRKGPPKLPKNQQGGLS